MDDGVKGRIKLCTLGRASLFVAERDLLFFALEPRGHVTLSCQSNQSASAGCAVAIRCGIPKRIPQAPQAQVRRFASSVCLCAFASRIVPVRGCFAAGGFLCSLSRSRSDIDSVWLHAYLRQAATLRTPFDPPRGFAASSGMH